VITSAGQDEHGNDFVAYTAVEPDSLIEFFGTFCHSVSIDLCIDVGVNPRIEICMKRLTCDAAVGVARGV